MEPKYRDRKCLKEQLDSGIGVSEIVRRCGCCRYTIYKYIYKGLIVVKVPSVIMYFKRHLIDKAIWMLRTGNPQSERVANWLSRSVKGE